MSEFGVSAVGEHEKQRDAAAALVQRVNAILMVHPNTLCLDIHDINNPNSADSETGRGGLMRMSAERQIQELAGFYLSIYPNTEHVPIIDGAHSVLPPHEIVTGESIHLSATTLALPNEYVMQAVSITVRDEYTIASSTIHINSDGHYDAQSEIRPRNNPLMTEALELVGVRQSGLIVPLFSGTLPMHELEESLNALKIVVSERYDAAETERFLSDVRNRYQERLAAKATAQELGVSAMSSDEMESLFTTLALIDQQSY